MLSRRRRWTLLALAVVLLTALLPTDSPLADHDRTDGTWTPAVVWQEVEIRHHNPWVCTNPPNSGPPAFTELDCTAFSTYPYVYEGATLGSSAPRGGLIVTACELDAGELIDCGHDPPSSQWTFAGSNHAIHQADVALQHGWLCPASAGGSGFGGATYDEYGHKTGIGAGPEKCGTFTPSMSSVSISDVTVSEDAGTARLPVTVSGSGSGSVNYATANGTATTSDYTAQTASLPNLVGGQSYTVNVPITDDSDVEGPETFTVTLSGASGVDIGTATATVTILDDDVAGDVSISGVTVTEGSTAVLNVTLTGGTTTGSVTYRTSDGTATAADYTSGTGTLAFTASPQTLEIRIPTTDDSIAESNETFTVELSSPSGVGIATGTATVTILDNDTLGAVNITGATVTEGAEAVLNVALTGGSVTGTVDYQTANGSAAAPGDYTTGSGTLTFTSNPQTREVRVQTTDDADVEGTETFTVRLSNPSGLSIATTQATVTVLDNDDPDPCPSGTTGTPPNCQPIPIPAGCDAPGTGLSSLTVTAGGSNQLSGFSSTTYSYSVTVDSFTSRVDATAANSSATVQIGRGTASVGSASRTVYLSEGSTSNQDVTVTAAGESCIYSLAVYRAAGPATDCPAWSGQVLVGGVCVPACTDPSWPVYDDNGEVSHCESAGDCPWDLMGVDPSILPSRRFYAFDALWIPGTTESDAVAAGSTTSVTRRAAKCPDHIAISVSPLEHDCVWRRFNIGGADGDCLSFALEVEAVVPAVEADSSYDTWEYQVSGCGHNRSGPRFTTWTADDATCSSTDTSWQRRPGSYCGPGCSTTAPTENAGEWEVTLGTLVAGGQAYVDVPLEVSVTDWGDASHLQITVWVTQPTLGHSGGTIPPVWQVSWSRSVTTTVKVPRRSGPPPSDDVIEVHIADVAALPYSSYGHLGGSLWGTVNRQFVDILRSGLLANDGCPIGADCTDPLRWPVEILGTHTGRCTLQAFAASSIISMQPTEQGLIGCDNLNNDSSYASSQSLTDYSARYWPRMWASGEDSFRYRTYGGEATVTIRFTDQVPAAPDITTYDPGSAHTVAQWGSGTPRRSTIRDSYGRIIGYKYLGSYTRVTGTDVEASHHAGVVSLAAVAGGDPDGDLDLLEITDANNPHLDGRVATIAADAGTAQTSFWRTEDTTSSTVQAGYGCWLAPSGCPTRPQLFEGFVNARLQRPYDTTTSATVDTRDTCTASSAATHVHFFFESSTNYLWSSVASPLFTWSSAANTDPGCIPQIAPSCVAGSLATWQMCYAVWPQTSNPAPLVADYRACDARRDAARIDASAFAEYLEPFAPGIASHLIRHRVAGNSYRPSYPSTTQDEWDAAIAVIDPLVHSRFCGDGTITVVLGDQPTVTIGPVSATEGSPLQFPVTLGTAAAVDVTVTFSTQPDTAGTDPAEASDYLAQTNATATIPAGQTSATATVFTVQDSIYENDETLRAVLIGADLAHLGITTEAVGTIANDDSLPVLSLASDVTAIEDTSGTPTDITFTVTLSPAATTTVTVTATTSAGTATGGTCGSGGADFASKTEVLTFNATETSKDFTVSTCPDTTPNEGVEDFTVTISGPSGATLGTSSATGQIVDNDSPPIYR